MNIQSLTTTNLRVEIFYFYLTSISKFVFQNNFTTIIAYLQFSPRRIPVAGSSTRVASSSQEKGPRLTRPTYMLIALNRRNRDQHNETDNQRTLLGLSSRFHIIMPSVQPCGPRRTVARRPYVPERLGECIRSGYTSLRHVAAFFCPAWWTRKSLLPRDPDRGTYVHIELYDWPHTLM